ncbi:MAG: hypothetical protein B0A82_17355 [Alkalinema sp. CACIAM 70d]|nr:MAG: hypothetical protein B0A82_17355 [Alkalinema sp. CACIAM 70d]
MVILFQSLFFAIFWHSRVSSIVLIWLMDNSGLSLGSDSPDRGLLLPNLLNLSLPLINPRLYSFL